MSSNMASGLAAAGIAVSVVAACSFRPAIEHEGSSVPMLAFVFVSASSASLLAGIQLLRKSGARPGWPQLLPSWTASALNLAAMIWTLVVVARMGDISTTEPIMIALATLECILAIGWIAYTTMIGINMSNPNAHERMIGAKNLEG